MKLLLLFLKKYKSAEVLALKSMSRFWSSYLRCSNPPNILPNHELDHEWIAISLSNLELYLTIYTRIIGIAMNFKL